MLIRGVVAAVLTALLVISGSSASQAASPQPGKKCTTAGQTKISNGKMYTCVSNKKKKPKRVWNSGSRATEIRRAYTKCKLWKTNDFGRILKFSTLADGGRTLEMDGVGKYQYTDTGPSATDMYCVLEELDAPSFVESQIGNTRAIDGIQEASWGNVRAFWNYHPDDGATITFTTVR